MQGVYVSGFLVLSTVIHINPDAFGLWSEDFAVDVWMSSNSAAVDGR